MGPCGPSSPAPVRTVCPSCGWGRGSCFQRRAGRAELSAGGRTAAAGAVGTAGAMEDVYELKGGRPVPSLLSTSLLAGSPMLACREGGPCCSGLWLPGWGCAVIDSTAFPKGGGALEKVPLRIGLDVWCQPRQNKAEDRHTLRWCPFLLVGN